jgi:NAD-dependent deacetylase
VFGHLEVRDDLVRPVARAEDLARAESAASDCDVLLAVGSTLSVWPVAGMVPLARTSGASIVVVNGGPTAMDDLCDVRVTGAIELVLPDLVVGLSSM